jgi:hypothetical protein
LYILNGLWIGYVKDQGYRMHHLGGNHLRALMNEHSCAWITKDGNLGSSAQDLEKHVDVEGSRSECTYCTYIRTWYATTKPELHRLTTGAEEKRLERCNKNALARSKVSVLPITINVERSRNIAREKEPGVEFRNEEPEMTRRNITW